MPTQKDIAAHLGLDQAAVSRHMAALGIDWKTTSMDTIRLAYIEQLRGQAAGHVSGNGVDLTYERAMTERVDRELKLHILAEKKGQLINIAQLEPELARAFGAFRAELLARDDKLKDELDALYGVTIDITLLNDHTRTALGQLARYDASRHQHAGAPGGAGAAAGSDGHHGLGAGAPGLVG